MTPLHPPGGSPRGRPRHLVALAAAATAVALLVALLVGLLVSDDLRRITGAGASPSMIVIGDSISANYVDVPGSPLQAWWSLVRRQLDYDVTVLAEPGSGYQRPGLACSGTEFGERPGVFNQPDPALIVVEGGRNDWAECQGSRLVPVEPQRVREAATDFLGQLVATYPTSRIVVLAPPWGPLQEAYAGPVTAAIAAAAATHDLQFVPMDDVLDEARAPDRVHPNIAGSRAIAEAVLEALDPGRSEPQ